MKICIVSRANPYDRRAFSGTSFNVFTSLKKNHEVEWIGEVALSRWVRYYLKLRKVVNRIRGQRITGHISFFSKRYGKLASKRLKNSNFDIIFAPAASECIAYLETDIPIIYLSDATFQALLNYYPNYSGLTHSNIIEGNRIEANAISKARRLTYSSHWAAASALEFYNADKKKITVVDFGPNLLRIPEREEIYKALQNMDTCNLLFLGVDWIRKGGDKTYKIFLKLKEHGFPCKLTIIGCNPTLEEDTKDVSIIPFLDKNKDKDFEKLFEIFSRTHFLLLPTIADCTPIVFSEAAAFGIPVLTNNTGGIPSVVNEGENGFMFPIDADVTQYVDKIREVLGDKGFYSELRNKCRDEFQNRLNWETWRERIDAVIAPTN